MSEMPARIWVKPFAIRSSDIDVKNAVISSLSADVPDNVAFVRADIAERMAEALEVLLNEATSFSVSGVYFDEPCMGHKGPDLARSALSAWKDGR